MALSDPEFLAVTFVVIDFETLTPAGRPAEPIEVAAVAGRFARGGQWRETGRYTSLMRQPDDVPVTRIDIAMNGLTADVLRVQRPPGEVMAELARPAGGPAVPAGRAQRPDRSRHHRRPAPPLPSPGGHSPAVHGQARPDRVPGTAQPQAQRTAPLPSDPPATRPAPCTTRHRDHRRRVPADPHRRPGSAEMVQSARSGHHRRRPGQTRTDGSGRCRRADCPFLRPGQAPDPRMARTCPNSAFA